MCIRDRSTWGTFKEMNSLSAICLILFSIASISFANEIDFEVYDQDFSIKYGLRARYDHKAKRIAIDQNEEQNENYAYGTSYYYLESLLASEYHRICTQAFNRIDEGRLFHCNFWFLFKNRNWTHPTFSYRLEAKVWGENEGEVILKLIPAYVKGPKTEENYIRTRDIWNQMDTSVRVIDMIDGRYLSFNLQPNLSLSDDLDNFSIHSVFISSERRNIIYLPNDFHKYANSIWEGDFEMKIDEMDPLEFLPRDANWTVTLTIIHPEGYLNFTRVVWVSENGKPIQPEVEQEIIYPANDQKYIEPEDFKENTDNSTIFDCKMIISVLLMIVLVF
eukprot:TRINITY_DN6920_c0_g1_i2.p1 TRINITY_DN6920_c0_g1~~TRINITY_DN6920_c0_g1_i2.p1  ORF type:complete len:333 (+),score=58.42 TRINITY_DN6920_c0_g1_i2:65-1063(+)